MSLSTLFKSTDLVSGRSYSHLLYCLPGGYVQGIQGSSVRRANIRGFMFAIHYIVHRIVIDLCWKILCKKFCSQLLYDLATSAAVC